MKSSLFCFVEKDIKKKKKKKKGRRKEKKRRRREKKRRRRRRGSQKKRRTKVNKIDHTIKDYMYQDVYIQI